MLDYTRYKNKKTHGKRSAAPYGGSKHREDNTPCLNRLVRVRWEVMCIKYVYPPGGSAPLGLVDVLPLT